MYIASQKRKENIAEYLLYMWHIEDIIRANGLDIDRIKATIIDCSGLNVPQRHELTEWYESLIDMMRREGVETRGHLQLNNNIISSLAELHQALLRDPKFADYTAEFYRTLPFIVELRAKAGDNRAGEIETCFTALYGMMMLRLRHRSITPGTEQAIKQISRFIALLASLFHKNEKEDIFHHSDHAAD